MEIRTDLALEARELYPSYEGVTEFKTANGGLEITRIEVQTEDAAKKLGKAMGRYVTIDAKLPYELDSEPYTNMAAVLSDELDPFFAHVPAKGSVLIVGLGNRAVTPDSLGPTVCDKLLITRHIVKYLPDAIEGDIRSVSAIAPGVLGTTGVETAEMTASLISGVKPDLVIAVDSLAAIKTSRIASTIQLSDAGIEPGSGVGNIRSGLDKNSLGVPVIAIGTPLVVYASTIVRDIAGEKTQVPDADEDLIVTPKDIDRLVKIMSGIIAEGISRAVFGERYEEIASLLQ